MTTGLPSEDLLSAVHLNRLDAAREALDRGASPDFTRTGFTPLLMAVTAGNQEMVELLLDRGANADLGNVTGWRALHTAAAAGHVAMLRPIAAKMMFAEITDEDGVDALRAAVDAQQVKALEELLAMKLSPNTADRKGVSPLAAAVMIQNEALVGLLDAAGANWDHAAQDGLTARDRLAGWSAGQRWARGAEPRPAVRPDNGSPEPTDAAPAEAAPEVGALGLSRIRRRNAL